MLFLFGNLLEAKVRTESDINNVAINLLTKKNPQVNYSIDIVSTENLLYSSSINTKNYKVVNLKPEGWVIVATDDVSTPILGYSDKGKIVAKNLPIQFKELLDGIDKEMESLKSKNLIDRDSLKEWNSLIKEPAIFKEKLLYSTRAILKTSGGKKGPLFVDTKWHQGYTKYTPKVYGRATSVGCAATAWAQLFAYHKWPTRGRGSNSYSWKGRTLSANFDTTYNWTNMSFDDKSKISYHIGIALFMNYGIGESLTSSFPSQISQFFRYKIGSTVKKTDANSAKWNTLLKRDIDNNRPVYLTAFSGRGGHAFVCDGYDFTGKNKLYHFNFGNADDNFGWYTLSSSAYNKNFTAIFNIEPDKKSIFIKKALLISPKNNQKLNSNTMTVKWKRNGVEKVKLLITNSGKKLFEGYVTGTTKVIRNLREDGSRLSILLSSYDKHGQQIIGADERDVIAKDVFLKNASLISPKSNQKLNSNTMTVKWKRNGAAKVKLLITNSGKKLFEGYVTGTSKVIRNLPAGHSKLKISLDSYDSLAQSIGSENVIVTTKAFEKARITNPKENQQLTSTTLNIEWSMNSAYSVGLEVYNYQGKYLFSAYKVAGTTKVIRNLPADGKELYIRLVSRDKYGNFKGKDELIVKVPKISNPFESARITNPKENQQLTSTTLNVKWHRKDAASVKLEVYSYSLNKSIFSEYVAGTSKVIKNLPEDSSKLKITLTSYDRNGHSKGREDFYVKAPKTPFKRAHITNLKENQQLIRSKLYIKWQNNDSSRIALSVYSYSLKKFLYFVSYLAGETSMTIGNLPEDGSKLRITLLSFDKYGQDAGSERIYVKAPKKFVPFKKARITNLKKNQQLTSTTLNVKWQRNDAGKVQLSVYNLTSNKTLYSEYVTGTSKVIRNLPEDGSRLRISVSSFTEIGGLFDDLHDMHDVIATKKYDVKPIKPTAPSNLNAINITRNTATLTWSDNSNNETGFKIYKGATLVKTVGVNVHSTTVIGLTPDTSYTYTVKAYSSAGQSAGTSKTFKTQKAGGVVSKSIITSPANNAKVPADTDITLRWENHGATKNYLEISYLVSGSGRYQKVYVGYPTGTSKVFKLPAGFTKAVARISSYNGSKDLGYVSVVLYPKK